MFFNKYSDYNTEDIVKPDFKEVCDKLLKIVKDEKIRRKVTSILYEGGFDDFTVNAEGIRNNPNIEQTRRLDMAYLLATNPETFEQIAKDNAIIFHGTTSKALEGIAKHGLCSGVEIENKGEEVKSGELWSKNDTNRVTVSCSNSLNLAAYYACKNTNENDFEVIINIRSDCLDSLPRTLGVSSDLPEIMFTKNIPLNMISSISVPKDKINEVNELFKDKGIVINSIDVRNPIYNLDLNYPEFDECNNYLSKLYDKNIDMSKSDTSQLDSLDNTESPNSLQVYKKDSKVLSFFKNIMNKFKNRKKYNNQLVQSVEYSDIPNNDSNNNNNSTLQSEIDISDNAFLSDIHEINLPNEVNYRSSITSNTDKNDKNLEYDNSSR